MTDHDDLGRRLGAALLDRVPEPPLVPDRVPDVVRRARRSRRRTAVVGAAAAVAATVGIASLLPLGRDEQTPGQTPVAGRVEAAECPGTAAIPVLRPKRAPELPAGAVEARLCQGPGNSFQPPSDALTERIGELTDAIEATPPRGRRSICLGDLGIGFSIVFAYADGSERTVTGEKYGCHNLVGAGPVRANADPVWATYLALLRDQRRDAEAPGAPSAPGGCADDQDLSPLARVVDFERARLCWTPSHGNEADWRSVVLTRSQLDAVLADLGDPANLPDPRDESCPISNLRYRLVGVTGWGDLGAAHGDCGTFDTNGRSSGMRRISPAVQIMIDRLTHSGS